MNIENEKTHPDVRSARALERIATALEVMAWGELGGFQPHERGKIAMRISDKFEEARNGE
jgi:putative component of toxin-antitoxin plasmid stabilization module